MWDLGLRMLEKGEGRRKKGEGRKAKSEKRREESKVNLEVVFNFAEKPGSEKYC